MARKAQEQGNAPKTSPEELRAKIEEKFWDPVKAGDQKDLIDIIFVSDDREINHFKRNIAKMP